MGEESGMSDQSLSDEEILYRRIPRGSRWFEPPDRLTSANFKLRRGEPGLSVYRASIVSKEEVLTGTSVCPGSLLAVTTVGDVRRAVNASGERLGLDVVATGDEDDPGHAEIRGPHSKKLSNAAAKAMKGIFKLVDVDSDEASSLQ